MRPLSLSRSLIYEVIRAGRLRTVKEGRTGHRHHRVRQPAGAGKHEGSSRRTEHRSRGDGGLHRDEARQRWIASVTVGYTAAGQARRSYVEDWLTYGLLNAADGTRINAYIALSLRTRVTSPLRRRLADEP
jgi:hypothetical protein